MLILAYNVHIVNIDIRDKREQGEPPGKGGFLFGPKRVTYKERKVHRMRNKNYRGLDAAGITIRLTKQHQEKLERLAEATGRPASGVLRRLLELAELGADDLRLKGRQEAGE